MRLRYTVGEAGWADVVLECGEQRVEMVASYLHDSLRDLLSAACAVIAGADMVTVVFMDEPGEHQVNIKRIRDHRIALEVERFSDWRSWGIAALLEEHAFSPVNPRTSTRPSNFDSERNSRHAWLRLIQRKVDRTRLPLDQFERLRATRPQQARSATSVGASGTSGHDHEVG